MPNLIAERYEHTPKNWALQLAFHMTRMDREPPRPVIDP